MIAPKQKIDTKTSIIKTAILCLETYGVEGFSIRTIAKNLGCATGLVNLHFGTKDSLMESVYITYTNTLEQQIVDISKDCSMDYKQKLKSIVMVYFGDDAYFNKQLNVWSAFWVLAKNNEKLNVSRIKHNAVIRKCVENICSDNDYNHKSSMLAIEFIALMDGLWLEMTLDRQVLNVENSIKILEGWINKI